MNRARRQQIFIYTGVTAGSLMGLYGIQHTIQYILSHAPVTVQRDTILDNTYADILTQKLTESIHTYGPAHFVQMYTKYSGLLSQLSIRYTFPLHATITYNTALPDVCLNDSIGLLPDGMTVPLDLFNAGILTTIPHIQVPTSFFAESELPKALKDYARQLLSTHLLDRFSCVWHDAHVCHYYDRNSAYTLVYEGYQPPTVHDIKLYDQVIARYAPDNKRTRWLVDLRFKNQVIISPDQGM